MSVKEQYRKYSLITIILGLGLLLFLKMTPFMGGILGACTIYIMVRDQMLYLTQKKKIRKSVTAIILLIEAILCFLVPLSLAVWLLISKLQTVNVDTATFVDTITNLADWIRRKTEYDLLSKENISSIASILPGIGQFLMGGISSFAVNLFTRVRDNILKSKEQKNIQPTKGGHKMVTCQNYVSLFYRQITSCPSDGGIS